MFLCIYESNYANRRFKVLVFKDVYDLLGFYLPKML